MRLLLLFILFISIPVRAEEGKIPTTFRVATIISYSLEKHLDEKDIRDRTPFIKSTVPNFVNHYYFMNYKSTDSNIQCDLKSEYLENIIKKTKPNLTTVYGVIAFEHFLVKRIYNKIDIETIFYCIPDYYYFDIVTRYNLEKTGKGIIQRSNIYDIFEFLKARNVNIDKVVLLRNKRIQDDPLAVRVKNSTEAEGYQFEVVKVDTENELKIAIRNHQSENTLLIYGLNFIFNIDNKELSNYELAMVIKKSNKKSPEVSLIRNLSRFGVAMSYVSFISQEESLNPYANCNTIFYHFIKNQPLASDQVLSDLSFVTNQNRLEELCLQRILDDTHNIVSIF